MTCLLRTLCSNRMTRCGLCVTQHSVCKGHHAAAGHPLHGHRLASARPPWSLSVLRFPLEAVRTSWSVRGHLLTTSLCDTGHVSRVPSCRGTGPFRRMPPLGPHQSPRATPETPSPWGRCFNTRTCGDTNRPCMAVPRAALVCQPAGGARGHPSSEASPHRSRSLLLFH